MIRYLLCYNHRKYRNALARVACVLLCTRTFMCMCVSICVCTWMVEYMRKAGGIDCFWRARSTNSTKITKQNEREREGGERPTKEQKLLECHKILCHLLYHSLSIVNVGFVSKWHASGRYTFWPQFFSAFICSVGRPFIHFVLDCWSVRFRCIFTSNSVFLIRFIFVSFSSSSFFIAKINVCCVLCVERRKFFSEKTRTHRKIYRYWIKPEQRVINIIW